MTILLERPFPPPTIPDFRAPDPTGARPAGWRIEETSNATGVPLPGPRWRPDGGPDGEPCVEVAGQEATYTIAAAEPVPVQPGRRYVVTFWVSSAGHYARYYQRGPGVRWLAADGRALAEPALPARILPGRRDDFAHEWRPVTGTAAAPDEAAFAVPAYRVGQ